MKEVEVNACKKCMDCPNRCLMTEEVLLVEQKPKLMQDNDKCSIAGVTLCEGRNKGVSANNTPLNIIRN